MTQNWSDEELVARWNADNTSFNPTRAEQLDILISVLADAYRPGTAILDVGFGSGIVEELIFRRIPDAYFVGVDISAPMVRVADERLAAYKDKYSVVLHDLNRVGTLELPAHTYSCALSVQVVHKLPDSSKLDVFRFIYQTLEPGGLFLMLDRVALDTPALFPAYRSVWHRLDAVYNAQVREGETLEDHLSMRSDLQIGLEANLHMMREAGFEAACLHTHGLRTVFAARKAVPE